MSQALDNFAVQLRLMGVYDNICECMTFYGMSQLDDATAVELCHDLRDVTQMYDLISDATFTHVIEDSCITITMNLQCASSGEWLPHTINLR